MTPYIVSGNESCERNCASIYFNFTKQQTYKKILKQQICIAMSKFTIISFMQRHVTVTIFNLNAILYFSSRSELTEDR